MQKELEFTLNEQMLSLLIHFNDLKQNLKLLEKQYTLDKNNKQLLLQIESTNEEMKRLRNRFIEEFRRINKEEIASYLKVKNQWHMKCTL